MFRSEKLIWLPLALFGRSEPERRGRILLMFGNDGCGQTNMTAATQYRKLNWLAILLGGALLVSLGGRLADLQVVQHERLQQLAQENTVRKFERQPMRGQILDSHHIPLATSQPAKVICADPTLIGDWREPVARLLSPRFANGRSAGCRAPRPASQARRRQDERFQIRRPQTQSPARCLAKSSANDGRSPSSRRRIKTFQEAARLFPQSSFESHFCRRRSGARLSRTAPRRAYFGIRLDR